LSLIILGLEGFNEYVKNSWLNLAGCRSLQCTKLASIAYAIHFQRLQLHA